MYTTAEHAGGRRWPPELLPSAFLLAAL